MTKFDDFTTALQRNEIAPDFHWNLSTESGDIETEGHVYTLCDNGYTKSRYFVMPYKVTDTCAQAAWSSMLESLRKDVECTFGILKQRFRILQHGLTIQNFDEIDDLWFTCCALHNIILEYDQQDIEEEELAPMDNKFRDMLKDGVDEEFEYHQDYEKLRNDMARHFANQVLKNEIHWPTKRKRLAKIFDFDVADKDEYQRLIHTLGF